MRFTRRQVRSYVLPACAAVALRLLVIPLGVDAVTDYELAALVFVAIALVAAWYWLKLVSSRCFEGRTEEELIIEDPPLPPDATLEVAEAEWGPVDDARLRFDAAPVAIAPAESAPLEVATERLHGHPYRGGPPPVALIRPDASSCFAAKARVYGVGTAIVLSCLIASVSIVRTVDDPWTRRAFLDATATMTFVCVLSVAIIVALRARSVSRYTAGVARTS